MAEEAGDLGAAGGSAANIDQQIQAANQQLQAANSPYIYTYDSNTMGLAQVANPQYQIPGTNQGGLDYGIGGGMTQYESAQIADAKARLSEQQREFDAKQAQEATQFLATQHTEEEKLQFAREQEQNKVQFQYAQLAQTQAQFEQTLGWDKEKFYQQFGLDVTKEQDAAVQGYRDALMKEQGSPQDMVSYLYNIRGMTAPAGGQSQALPIPPGVLAAMQAQGIPIPNQGQQAGLQQSNYQNLGNLPYGFGGGAGNMGGTSPQIPTPANSQTAPQLGLNTQLGLNMGVGIPLGQPQGNGALSRQVTNPLQFTPAGPQAQNPLAYSPSPSSMTNWGPELGPRPGLTPQSPQSQFNVWNYLPPQLKGFFTPSQATTPNFPGTGIPAQPSAIIPSAQMYNQLLPSEQGALQSFQSQQLGIMPKDMQGLMEQTAPIETSKLAPDIYK